MAAATLMAISAATGSGTAALWRVGIEDVDGEPPRAVSLLLENLDILAGHRYGRGALRLQGHGEGAAHVADVAAAVEIVHLQDDTRHLGHGRGPLPDRGAAVDRRLVRRQ